MAATVRRVLLLAGIALYAGSAQCSDTSPVSRHEIETLVSAELKRRSVPGGALVILKGDSVWLASGFGQIGLSDQTPVTVNTLFQLGSIGKSFLAALVLELARQGKFSVDDPIADRLPSASSLPRSITIRHLLNHTSGLREQFLLPGVAEGTADLSRPKEELYALIVKAPVDFPAGARWSYSNTNYTLLAMLVEHVVGQPYEVVLDDVIFRPLGLGSLRQCQSIAKGPDEARGHARKRNAEVVESAPENMNWIRGDGGLCGSALDLARWIHALTVERPSPMTVAHQMKLPTRTAALEFAEYGFGLSLVRPDAVARFGHNGAMLGFSASAAAYPAEQLTIVVLANRGDVRTESIERLVARRLLGIPEPRRQAVALSDAQRRMLVGSYDIGVFDVRILEQGGALWLQSPRPGPSGRLVHVGDCVFVLEAEPDANQAVFSCDSARRVTLRMGAMNWYGAQRQ